MSRGQYPRYDLRSVIDAARVIRSKSQDGRSANSDELATFLGYRSKVNGAYLTRVAAMKMFGLLEGRGDDLRLTDRALAILEPDLATTADQAKLDAFFSVPLYSDFFDRYGGANRELPEGPEGMKNALQNFFGVDEKQTAMVLARMLDSADEAGLFRVAGTRSKMIRPTLSPSANEEVVHGESADDDSPPPPPPSRPPGVLQHKLIDGMLDLLPNERKWTEAKLQQWLALWGNALRLYYELPAPSDDSRDGAQGAARLPIVEGGGR